MALAVLVAGGGGSTSAARSRPRTDPGISARIEKLATQPLGAQQEAEYAEIDKEVMEAAPLVPYGNATAPKPQAKATSRNDSRPSRSFCLAASTRSVRSHLCGAAPMERRNAREK